jgi:retron-type reverse transcriptase
MARSTALLAQPRKASTSETVDGMSLQKIEDIIGALRLERYQWQPARRTSIAKRNGKKRPLGLPVWSDKPPFGSDPADPGRL